MARRRRIWKRRRCVDPHAGLTGDERTYAVQLARFRGDEERARDAFLGSIWWREVDAVDAALGIEDSSKVMSEEEGSAYDAEHDAHWARMVAEHPLLSKWKAEGHPCKPQWVIAQAQFEEDFERTHHS
jgi:hypothetical protein